MGEKPDRRTEDLGRTGANGSIRAWIAAATLLFGGGFGVKGLNDYRVETEGRTTVLEGRLAEQGRIIADLRTWRDAWRDRVIPLDDDQSEAIESLLARIDKLERHMGFGARYSASDALAGAGCDIIALEALKQVYLDRESGSGEKRPGIRRSVETCIRRMEAQVKVLLGRKRNGP